MDGGAEKLAELFSSLQGTDEPLASGATSPGPGPAVRTLSGMVQDKDATRSRPRTFPYLRYLPYEVETSTERQKNLQEILKHLYISIEAGDFAVGAVHWTRELRNWLSLKFDLAKSQRVKLVKLYYELALAPGVDSSTSEKFASTFNALLK